MVFRLYFAREEHKNAGYPNFLTYIYDRKQEKQKEIKTELKDLNEKYG